MICWRASIFHIGIIELELSAKPGSITKPAPKHDNEGWWNGARNSRERESRSHCGRFPRKNATYTGANRRNLVPHPH